VFVRKPIFGYRAMVFSMISIAFLSWVVWGHHMFQSGMNPALGTAFMLTTMFIAVPSAIKTFNWLGTLWGGKIRFTSPMLFALGFVSLFTIGGLSGIFMASTPVDIFIHDTYYIVAHIHYVVAGIIFGIFAGLYFWFPKMFGRMMNEKLGKIHFFLTFVFFNLTFFPMHFLGVGGHMRRIYDPTQYKFLEPFYGMNTFITVMALCLGASQIFFVINFIWSLFAGPRATENPWQANTLEWDAPSPRQSDGPIQDTQPSTPFTSLTLDALMSPAPCSDFETTALRQPVLLDLWRTEFVRATIDHRRREKIPVWRG
jgi:cytochrome c oxidase subunit I